MKQITKVLLAAILLCTTAFAANAVVYKTNTLMGIDEYGNQSEEMYVKGQVSINVTAAGKGTIVLSQTQGGRLDVTVKITSKEGPERTPDGKVEAYHGRCTYNGVTQDATVYVVTSTGYTSPNAFIFETFDAYGNTTGAIIFGRE